MVDFLLLLWYNKKAPEGTNREKPTEGFVIYIYGAYITNFDGGVADGIRFSNNY